MIGRTGLFQPPFLSMGRTSLTEDGSPGEQSEESQGLLLSSLNLAPLDCWFLWLSFGIYAKLEEMAPGP